MSERASESSTLSELASESSTLSELASESSTLTELVRCSISDVPLDADEHRRAVTRDGSGAEVVFCGVVRDHDRGRSVTALEYVGHPSAAGTLRDVASRVAAEPGVAAIAVSHRVGKLGIGDVALVAAVSAAHRGEAFAACGRLVDEVKRELPIWKRQVFADATDEWVNCP